MAITGKFIADFESFYSAVQKAEVSLRGFEGGAGKVETSLNRMANSLSGTKLISDATLMSEAVERIGGVSKLTESELGRVSAQAKEAAAKLVAMGQDVPPGIQKIADATKSAGSQIDQMKNFATSAAGAFGIAFGVGQVVQFGKSVFDSASKIHDLAEQMGISTDAVQGFKFAAEQAGSSLDTVSTAITKMNAKLAEGDKSTVKALQDAGLGFQQIRSMAPEDAFLAITDAVQQIEDPMVQTDVALKLFGKSAAELLPAIKEGFRGAAEGASKMSEDTIKSLEAAQDAWDRLGNKVTIVSGTIIAAMLDTTKQATKSVSDFGMFADNVIKFGIGTAVAMAQAQEGIERVGRAKDVYLGSDKPLHPTPEELAAAAAAAKRWADQLEASFRKFSGKDIAEQAKVLDITFRRMADSGQITAQQLNNIATEAAKLSAQGALLSPRLWDLVLATGQLDPNVTSDAEAFARLGEKLDLTIPKLSAFAQASEDLQGKIHAGVEGLSFLGLKVGAGLEDVTKKTKTETDAVGELARAFAQLSQIAGGTLGGLVRDFGTIIAAADTAKKSIEGIKSGLGKGTFSGLLEGVSGMLGLASAAISAGKAIANLFNRDKGRDIVEDFAKSFGGFDALHVKLNELGAEGEKLWIALTQGVGKNNPQQAQAAIDAITKALEKKADASEDAQVMSEAEAQATIETATAAAKALDDVNDRLAVNRDAWAAWSVDVTGFLQKLADEIRRMPIPSPTGTSGGGGSATYRAPTGGGRAGSVVVPVHLDGKVITTVVARNLPTVLRQQGVVA